MLRGRCVLRGCWALRVDAEAPRRTRDRDRTIGVRTEHPRPGRFEQLRRDGRRVSVVIVGADGDHRGGGIDGSKEAGVLVPRPMVRHLQHVGAHVGTGPEHRALGRWLDVAGEERAHACWADDPHDQARVVLHRLRGVQPCQLAGIGWRPQHLEVERADRGRPADRQRLHLDAAAGDRARHLILGQAD